MKMDVQGLTAPQAEAITSWAYEGEYSIYNHNDDFLQTYMDGRHFAFVSVEGELLGYMCFGEEARIPTVEEDVYCDNFLDIGLHIRPDLTGKGLGKLFLKACLEHAEGNSIRATIASFNRRAINLCVSAGFVVKQEVTHRNTGCKFSIVTL